MRSPAPGDVYSIGKIKSLLTLLTKVDNETWVCIDQFGVSKWKEVETNIKSGQLVLVCKS